MIGTLALEEDNRMKTVLQQLDSERRKTLHIVCLRVVFRVTHTKKIDLLKNQGRFSNNRPFFWWFDSFTAHVSYHPEETSLQRVT